MNLRILHLFSALTFLTAGTGMGKELPTSSWEEHGHTKAELESIRAAFQIGIDKSFIPGGSLMLIHKGDIILKEGFGLANLESKTPFSADAPCRIASLTKPHTTTMVAMLVDQGKLSFGDTVDEYIPEFRKLKVQGQDKQVTTPTLAQCLSHTTGFPSNNDLNAGKFSLNFNGTLETVTRELASKELFHAPGTNYAYSRLGFMTAGRVVEIVTNLSYEEAMKKILFDRIGAKESTFDLEALEDRIPTAYERTKSGLMVRTGEGLGTTINPGGALIATPDGIARLFMLHRNQGKVDGKQIISKQVLQKMYVPQPGSEGSGMGYGLGFRITQKRPDGTANRIQHTGGSGTIGIIDFDLDLIVIILTQVPQAQTNRWRQPLLQTIFGVFENQWAFK